MIRKVRSRLGRLKRKILGIDASGKPLKFPANQQEQFQLDEVFRSGFFDADWYRLAYGESETDPVKLFKHYVRTGIPNERDPNPYFNNVLYRRAFDVTLDNAFLHFISKGLARSYGAFWDDQSFLKTQEDYRDKTETTIYKVNENPPRQFLVFLQSGEGTSWLDWPADEPRGWDLMVNHYDQKYRCQIKCEVELHQTGKLPGTKCTAFYDVLKKFPDLVEPYKYIALLDDDVVFKRWELTKLFSKVKSHALQMAQASLSSESSCSYPVFYHQSSSSRRVNGVEVMMPVFSQSILLEVKALIGQSISGWGFDSALAMVASEKGWKARVMDEIIADHLKPINADIGKFYQMLHKEGIFPEIEFTHLQKKYSYTKPLFYEV